MLKSPIDEAKSHIELLDALGADVKRSIGDLRALLVGEQSRIIRVVEDDAREFVQSVRAEAIRALLREAAHIPARGGSLRRELTRAAQRIAEQRLAAWVVSEGPRIEAYYAQCMQRFVESARRFLDRLAPSGETHLDSTDLKTVAPFLPKKSGYYYGRFESIAMDASPIRIAADLVRGALGARRGIEREAELYLARLLESNASRIQFDLRERLDEARRRFERDLSLLLEEILVSAKRNLRRVRDTHSQGQAAVATRLADLARQKEELRLIQASVPLVR